MSNDQHDHDIIGTTPDGTPIFHGPDGLSEADHAMPRWMVLVFWGTVAWGIGYVVLLPGLGINLLHYSQYKVYDAEVAEAKAKYASTQGGDVATLVAAAMDDPAAAERGKAVYAASCAACHAPDGQGAIGPSLVDATWLYGSKPAEVAHTIAAGTAKGMPPFKTSLAPSAVADVTAFIASLKK
ncbi:MAG: c-type cytochrome [Candidatus Sericytochromatia bacterium]